MTLTTPTTRAPDRDRIQARIRAATPAERHWITAMSGVDHKTLARLAAGRPVRSATLERIAAALREIDRDA